VGTFVGLAVVLAFVFVRLGFWQLDRLSQRRARNATVASRLDEPARPFEQLPDSASFSRVSLAGTPDYSNEIVLTGRSRNGSPGVYILTPVRRPSTDTAVVVLRGWVYAPDAATVDLSRWRESRTAFQGYVVALPPSAQARIAGGRKLRALSSGGVRGLLPYPASSRYVVSRDSASDGTPARLEMPALDSGPHLSYAIQWFSFAAIAIVGAAIVAFRARVSPDGASVESVEHVRQ
jgi:surfeit locus 1 family protein